MITRIQASNYRCLRSVDQPLGPFHVLVGPNASGKSTFLDVVAFLRTVVSQNLDTAISDRTENFHDLVWGRQENRFELGIDAQIPRFTNAPIRHLASDIVRYTLAIRIDPTTDTPAIEKESLVVVASDGKTPGIEVLSREQTRVRFREETGAQAQDYSFDIPANFSGLASPPPDESKFPATIGLRGMLSEGVQLVALEPRELRKASFPPHRKARFDGSNLARFVVELKRDHRQSFKDWQEHLRTTLPDLEEVRVVLRADDRSRYIVLRYANGVEVPSWMLSDGTLRLMALTLFAYAPGSRGIYLIEEPENGIHPTGIEAVFQSLSSVYDNQVLIATHSPIILGLTRPEQILCFSKDSQGATEMLRGDQHPVLKEWKGEVSLSDLFAAGVLG
jgi:predicted ATPase